MSLEPTWYELTFPNLFSLEHLCTTKNKPQYHCIRSVVHGDFSIVTMHPEWFIEQFEKWKLKKELEGVHFLSTEWTGKRWTEWAKDREKIPPSDPPIQGTAVDIVPSIKTEPVVTDHEDPDNIKVTFDKVQKSFFEFDEEDFVDAFGTLPSKEGVGILGQDYDKICEELKKDLAERDVKVYVTPEAKAQSYDTRDLYYCACGTALPRADAKCGTCVNPCKEIDVGTVSRHASGECEICGKTASSKVLVKGKGMCGECQRGKWTYKWHCPCYRCKQYRRQEPVNVGRPWRIKHGFKSSG